MDTATLNYTYKHSRHFILSALLSIISFFPFRSLLFRFFMTVTPSVPATLQTFFSFRPRLSIFWWACFSAFFYSFVMTALLTYVNGTWAGTDPHFIYFSTDTVNIILYILVVPLYTGFLCSIISTFIHEHAALNTFANTLQPSSTISSLRFPLILSLIPVISGWFTYVYISDIVSNAQHASTYWFLVEISNTKFLNSVGIYYVLLNFLLLTIVITALFCFFSIFFEVINIGNRINSLRAGYDISWEIVNTKLSAFTHVYMLAKWACVMLTLNVLLWQTTELANTSNMEVSIAVISIMGLFFVALPRYHVLLMWRNFQMKSGLIKATDRFPELETDGQQLAIGIADGLLALMFFNVVGMENILRVFGLGKAWSDIIKPAIKSVFL